MPQVYFGGSSTNVPTGNIPVGNSNPLSGIWNTVKGAVSNVSSAIKNITGIFKNNNVNTNTGVGNSAHTVSQAVPSGNGYSGTALGSYGIDQAIAQYDANAWNSAQEAYRQSSYEAQVARDWSKMMSDTAHQREVADLKAAGLNPVLSANSGAAVPSAASGSGYVADNANGAQMLASLVGTAMSANAMVQCAQINSATQLAVSENNNYNSMTGFAKNAITKAMTNSARSYEKLFNYVANASK